MFVGDHHAGAVAHGALEVVVTNLQATDPSIRHFERDPALHPLRCRCVLRPPPTHLVENEPIVKQKSQLAPRVVAGRDPDEHETAAALGPDG